MYSRYSAFIKGRRRGMLAGEGAQEKLLVDEFPDLPFLSLEGYRIRYAKSAFGLLKNILFQAPKILKAIKKPLGESSFF